MPLLVYFAAFLIFLVRVHVEWMYCMIVSPPIAASKNVFCTFLDRTARKCFCCRMAQRVVKCNPSSVGRQKVLKLNANVLIYWRMCFIDLATWSQKIMSICSLHFYPNWVPTKQASERSLFLALVSQHTFDLFVLIVLFIVLQMFSRSYDLINISRYL